MPAAVLRLQPRRAVVLIVVLAVAMTATTVLLARRAEAAITDPFTSRFQANTNGAIILRGNANLACSTSDAGCTTALNGTATGDALDNNAYVMQNIDTDSDPTTFNASSSTVSLPTGSTVLFAGLYWSADPTKGTSGAAAPTAANRDKVLFRTPAGPATWNNVTADKVFTNTGIQAYQGFKDVTPLVSGAGSGVYTVANIQAGTGKDRYAGWSLVIAYKNSALPMHSLRVYDGFGVVKDGDTKVDIAVSGFQTPHTGTVNAAVGTVVYEGDRGKTGDSLQIGTASKPLASMSDAKNPADNFFNSTNSEDGTSVAGRAPNNDNLMGVDLDRFDASGKLGNDETTATLRLTTGGETFYPGVVTFTTDLYAPNVIVTPAGVDLNGGDLLPGDTVEYRVDVRNDGTDTANSVTLSDVVPAGTSYIGGSLTVAGTSVTDAADADAGKITGGTTSFAVGNLAPGATKRVTFRVRVDIADAPGTTIVNTANADYTAAFTNGAGTSSGTSSMTVQQPKTNLAATLTVAPAVVQRAASPNTVTYTATVKNSGTDLEPAPKMVLTLPAGVTPGTLPTGCSAAGQVVTCTRPALAANTSDSLPIPAVATGSAVAHPVASLQVSGTGLDPDSSDNTATATLAVNSAPVAVDDTAPTTDNATPVGIDVKSNDHDDDDATSDLVVQIDTAPAHGRVVVNTDGTITYTPRSSWAGPETFTYRLLDGRGGSSVATVSVTTRNAPPVAVTDNYSAKTGGPALTFSPKDNDTDLNGQTLSIASVDQPATGEGTVTISGDQVTYLPDATFQGTTSFHYVVSDGNGGTDTGTINITLAGSAPVAVTDTATVAYGGNVTIDALANDADNNGDPLTITSVDQPAHGSTSVVSGEIVYQAPTGFSGPDTFTYHISDNHGNTATGTVTVTVGNGRPTAGPVTATTGTNTAKTIDVLAAASDPNAGDHLTVTGITTPAHGTVERNADGTLTYTPTTGYSGADTFTYTVSDGHPGGSASNTVSVTVNNAPPVAVADAVTVPADQPSTVSVLANDTDPNTADHLTATIDQPPLHGTAQVNANGTVTYTPSSGFVGTDTFHYLVGDGNGGSDGASVTLSVVNSAPSARPDSDATDTNTAVTLAVLANDTDPNNDALTVTAVTAPGHGQAAINADGTVTYTPSNGFCGTDTFTYTVSDPSGTASTAVVTITVRNAAPIAVDDDVVVRPGVLTTLDVLGNDTDPNTGQGRSVASVVAASRGTVTLNADGTVTYRTSATSGTDTFDYVLTDDLGLTDTATVTITIDAAPIAVDDVAPAAYGTAGTISVLANDTDPESEALTLVSATAAAHGTAVIVGNQIRYTPAAGFFGTDTFGYTIKDTVGNTATATVTVQVSPGASDVTAAVLTGHSVDVTAVTDSRLTVSHVDTPAHGTATVVNGKIRYTPAAGFTGTDTFSYTVSDGNGHTATATVTITVSDSAPVAVTDKAATAYGKPVTVRVLGNDLDPNGGLAVTSTTTPAHGTVTFTGDKVVYTPAAGFSGSDTFDYTAKDGDGHAVTATVTITVGAPPVVPDKTATAKPGTAVRIALPTTDQNGTPVTIKSVGKAKHGAVKLNADGTVTYTPAKGFAGVDTFTYQAVDADGNLATASVKVTVTGANKAPTAKNDKATVAAGSAVVLKPQTNDSDPNSDKLTVTKIGKPKHGTAVLNANGTVTYAPVDGFAGQDSFSYTVSDGHGGTATATVTITVAAAVTAGGSGGNLARTGDNLVPVAVTGALVVLLGGAMVWFGGGPGRPSLALTGRPLLTLAGRGPGRHRPGRHRG
ncbi:hypothetical protein GCM10010172_27390 [Paractinoplanes ferrugineus]|uniref:Repeat protein (TIGR01451 family) n=1 Tax=Paractinoplanes ferrugineus TaxID=113564 RepID=A0A919ISR9_9ACTN|nr:Ig-like domain-containing protein [Actinoplanes ferrugineus]GIE08351.1 hypothetical protein Afe05nite_01910 [Actinoplanes ferrugineus]